MFRRNSIYSAVCPESQADQEQGIKQNKKTAVGYRFWYWEYEALILFILSWQAIINEDTQGNVRQLQAEVKKLKEQLAHALASQAGDCGKDVAPGGPALQSGI